MNHDCTDRRPPERGVRWLGRVFWAVAGAVLLGAALLLLQGLGHTPPTARAAEDGDWEQNAQTLSAADKLDYIRAHPEDYTADLMDLAENNGEAIDYVYLYPLRKDDTPEIDLTDEAAGEGVPRLIQWDARWGYLPYGDGLIGYTGCGPTCLSMVALALTGNADLTPAYVARWAEEGGYYVSGSGTAWSLMSSGCAQLGLTSAELPLDELRMAAQLEQGHPIICSMGPGDFTTRGHFVVLWGYEDGAFRLNDPNSPERSERAWRFEELSGQIKNLWAFWVE